MALPSLDDEPTSKNSGSTPASIGASETQLQRIRTLTQQDLLDQGWNIANVVGEHVDELTDDVLYSLTYQQRLLFSPEAQRRIGSRRIEIAKKDHLKTLEKLCTALNENLKSAKWSFAKYSFSYRKMIVMSFAEMIKRRYTCKTRGQETIGEIIESSGNQAKWLARIAYLPGCLVTVPVDIYKCCAGKSCQPK
jgi:hypothetical protein